MTPRRLASAAILTATLTLTACDGGWWPNGQQPDKAGTFPEYQYQLPARIPTAVALDCYTRNVDVHGCIALYDAYLTAQTQATADAYGL